MDNNKHDLYLDTLKGSLIILVIVGHVLQLGEDRFSTSMINWIYTFHMPLFIFVSGYFTNVKGSNIKKSTIKLLETYIILQIFRSAIEGNFNFHSLMNPRMALWYLLSLVYWRFILFFAINILKVNGKLLLLISIITSLLSVFIPYTTLMSFQRTFAFFPFYICGYICRTINYRKFLSKLNFSFAATILVVTMTFFYFENKSFLMELSGTLTIYNGGGVLLRLIQILAGSIMSICFMKITFCENLPVLSFIGKNSLHFYIFHIFIWLILKPLCQSGYLSINFIWLIVYACITILILYYTSHLSFFKYILNPLTNIYTKWKNQ